MSTYISAMGKSTRVSDVLLVRHLPGILSSEDQKELLKHFGAVQVKCLGTQGPLKYCAFAKFNEVKSAEEALKRLHQFHILGHTISAEFSRKSFDEVLGEKATEPVKKDDPKQPEKTDYPEKLKIQENVDSVSQKWNLRYPFNPKLKYVYPPPSAGILANISSALIAVPKFYVQVLHLMNKMNLPAPFGIVTPVPPLLQPESNIVSLPVQQAQDEEVETIEMEVESTEESELETDSGGENRTVKPVAATVVPKRKKNVKQHKPKKPRLLATHLSTVLPKSQSVPSMKPTEVFEQPTALPAKKIEIKFGQEALAFTPDKSEEPVPIAYDPTEVDKMEAGSLAENKEESVDHANAVTVVEGGFGKIVPVPLKDNAEDLDDSSDEEGKWGSGEFISSKLLRRGRLTSREIKGLNVFKKYEPGEPTTRLYIKNLAKQTVEKDLHYVFGKYVNWQNESEKNMFDIRLMKEGRMKGQCFVTLASESKAKQAREDTNGYQLNGKPMVVQFARSAKPKDSQ